jgi:lipopolysaccharide biosynthesis glycosyltransferase
VRAQSRIVTADLSATEGLPRHRRISRSAYLRLMIGDLLPKEVSRALYIDGDTLVLRDVAVLFDLDLGNAPAAAAASAGSPKYGNGKRPWAQLGIDPETTYVNSGVLLIDVERWRAEGIGRAVLADIAEHHSLYRWMDQDGLNAVLANRWALFPPEWNLQLGSKVHRRDPPALETVGICHFTGIWKPWKPAYAGSFTLGADDPGFRAAWLTAARDSGWFTRMGWTTFRAGLLLRRLAAPAEALARRAAVSGTR